MSAFGPKRTSGGRTLHSRLSLAHTWRLHFVRCGPRRHGPRLLDLAEGWQTPATCRSRTDSVKSVEGRRCSKLWTGSKGSVSGNTLSALPRMISALVSYLI